MTRSSPRPGFPPAVREVFDELTQEVSWLHADWSAYREIFGVSANLDVINETLPDVFAIFENSLRTDMVMSVGRLTDPLVTGSGKKAKDNICLERLLHVIQSNCTDLQFIVDSEKKKDAILKLCAPIKDLRNRGVGHTDLGTALKFHLDPLPNITRPFIQECLDKIAQFMNDVEIYFEDAETYHKEPLLRGSGKDLIFYLKEYLRLHEEDFHRKNGRPSGARSRDPVPSKREKGA